MDRRLCERLAGGGVFFLIQLQALELLRLLDMEIGKILVAGGCLEQCDSSRRMIGACDRRPFASSR